MQNQNKHCDLTEKSNFWILIFYFFCEHSYFFGYLVKSKQTLQFDGKINFSRQNSSVTYLVKSKQTPRFDVKSEPLECNFFSCENSLVTLTALLLK